jgi:hypothetical protein
MTSVKSAEVHDTLYQDNRGVRNNTKCDGPQLFQEHIKY